MSSVVSEKRFFLTLCSLCGHFFFTSSTVAFRCDGCRDSWSHERMSFEGGSL